MTPFYEFKCLERLPLLPKFRGLDEYCVASSVGQNRLRRAGVPAQNIYLTGAPQFDPLSEPLPTMRGGAGLTILYADQRLEDSERLGQRLLQYVADHPSNQVDNPAPSNCVRIRLRLPWQKELDRWCQKAFARLSPATSPLTDDLANASVVVSISSMVLYESILRGRPALSSAARDFAVPAVFFARLRHPHSAHGFRARKGP